MNLLPFPTFIFPLLSSSWFFGLSFKIIFAYIQLQLSNRSQHQIPSD